MNKLNELNKPINEFVILDEVLHNENNTINTKEEGLYD